MKPQVEYQYCHDLFSWEEFEHILNIRPLLTRERIQLNFEGKFQWNDDPWSNDNNCIPPHILKDAIHGKTFYLTDMSRMTKRINGFAHELEQEYNMACDAHVYTCLDSQGEHPFGIHFDMSDNVIVQCEGTTQFKVWDSIPFGNSIMNQKEYEAMNPYKMDITDDPILNVELNPGDAIWIPRTYPHEAVTKSNKRLSVSFPLAYGSEQMITNREWINVT